MKQVVAGRGGHVDIVETAPPSIDDYGVLIATEYSLISTGTERAALARSGGPRALARQALTDSRLRGKAMSRVQSQGIAATVDEARRRSTNLQPLGYSAAGRVLKVGAKVTRISVGQYVAAAGSGYANHAEIISVPASLVTPVPSGVSCREAAFATIGAIALHGFRMSRAAIGETVVVVGLGLVGQLAAQIAASAGCRIIGVERNRSRRVRAERLVPDGVFVRTLDDALAAIETSTLGAGADATVITAASAEGSLANNCLRTLHENGRLVIVGDVAVDLDRDLMYYGELSVTVSRSYGPGRYDSAYETRGADYPIGQVRWTEGRNFASVLDLISRRRIDVRSLITAVVPVGEADRAYQLAADGHHHLAVLLAYPTNPIPPLAWSPPGRAPISAEHDASTLGIAIVGPGVFATTVLVPALQATSDVLIRSVVARSPAAAETGRRMFRATRGTGEMDDVLNDRGIQALVIATRHDSHAELAIRGMRAGKHVFVEKPLGLTLSECEAVVAAAVDTGCLCMVDFNRRFSPHARLMRRERAAAPEGTAAVYRVNAGRLAANHWTLDPVAGGGRVIGEAVHFLDLLCWLFDAEPTAMVSDPRAVADPLNEVVCTLLFTGGRSATLIYNTHGDASTPKERIEIIGGGHVWTLDDFQVTRRDGKALLKSRPAKGHVEALRHFIRAARGQGELAVTALDGLRATRLALEAQGRLG